MAIQPSSALLMIAAMLTLSSGVAPAAKEDKEPPTRTVKGMLTNEAEEPIAGVIQLKNLKTLEVRSYHVREDGRFYFSGLDPNSDYELRAIADGYREKTRRISSFDDRMELYYLMKLKRE